ncbi:deoxyguanosinetriphosphate triphosphohydrolase family protein [Actinoplanes friuliensis]|uniref:Putative deoxyguanosinetriphosphate triphosphohydrolase n=1 Tax=Actinoplanes friuliensis DSM 7358 TaxID=1246995 RepID=U5WBE1_9ACTN|nr:dNTP triphosphohydrolase [Actinoplanes friuliensis]AGZ45261.1 putative deoxyguanosinetriphosphate triphosphohydrolase [Actinoplanes friuliensis DSM 7358]
MDDPRARRLFGDSLVAPGDLAASPFRVDRDRIVSSPFFARLAGVTQVISPGGAGLLVHNRLTHSLKVAQVGRAIAERLLRDQHFSDVLEKLGGCDPDVVEAAALAHDLGHPPFGHLGERVLDQLARQRLRLRDGFEGNAQSYRIVTSTEIRGEATIGLNLTAATRAAILKYPWTRRTHPAPHPRHLDPPPRGAAAPPDDPDGGSLKFGAYSTEVEDMVEARLPFAGRVADWQQTAEASVMDTADDIAYAIHDLEDVHRVGVLQQGAVAAELMAWQRSSFRDVPDEELALTQRRPGHAIEALRRQLHRKDSWVSNDEAFAAAVEQVRAELVDGLLSAPFDGSLEAEAQVAAFSATWTRRLVESIEATGSPAVRSGHVLLAPVQWHEVQVLKFVQNRFVLARPDLALHQRGQARLLSNLVEALLAWLADPAETERLPRRIHDLVELAEAELPDGTPDRVARARGRAIVDYVAALTDSQAVALMEALSGRTRQLWTDAFVL